MKKRIQLLGVAAVGAAAFLAVSLVTIHAQQPAGAAVKIDNDDIGGVVTSSNGPEAGVWVIAETRDLPTRLIKTVVTDDRGRYLIPDLPAANYDVWVRGYGLVDSAKVKSAPGKLVNLTATIAPDAKAAAQYYPANYWYSMMPVPPKSDFPGTGPKGNGISEGMKYQGMFIDQLKTNNCQSCHQLGDKATREIPKSLGHFDSTAAAWQRRVQSSQDGGSMLSGISRLGQTRAMKMFAEWTDSIAAGAIPPSPPRPQGVERNVVVTQWDWAEPTEYFHDEVSTDRRNPAVNAKGLVYGVHEFSSDFMSVVDPAKNTKRQIKLPVRDEDTPYATPRAVQGPSPYWGEEVIWNSKGNAHSVVMDGKGRLWLASVIRSPESQPAFCKAGSSHPSAKAFPVNRSGRQLSMYDPATDKWELIDLCFSTHHLQFAEDANNTLWFCGGTEMVGWFNTKMWDETHDAAKSQGWTALVLDTNGNGKRDDYVEPGQPPDPNKDTRIKVNYYGIVSSPVDHSVWGTVLGFPGSIVRLNPGTNPPETALAEIYELPWGNPKAPVQGYGPRGLDIDRNGVVWTVLSSGHFASFDRRKCKVTNGPTATGQQCPEGWTLYPVPGPNFKGTDSGSADTNYYDWVDQYDTLGLGKNTPIAIGNDSDSLLALVDGKFQVLRIPYPMGFFSKGMDGRIDDPKAGWKGKGIWTTYATRAPWHMETGKGTTSKAVHFQMRPNPLAD